MELSLAANLALFVLCCGVVWSAGTRLARHAKALAERGGGQALVGTVLLGGIASLPEAATSLSAALLGNASLAVNTLLGGITFSLVILAVTDAAIGREPLSTDITRPVVLLEGAAGIFLLAALGAGLAIGDRALVGGGVCTMLLLVFYGIAIALIGRYQRSESWITNDARGKEEERGDAGSAAPPRAREPTRRVVLSVVLAGIAVLAAGYVLARSGDALAKQTGLGASFVGFILGGIATSLPELSSTTESVRLRQYEMAFSDAFGTNLFSVMLLFFVDLAYAGGPILGDVGRFSLFGTLLGIALTAVYVGGIVEHRKRAVLRMGIDSIIVLVVASVGLVLLYTLRQ